MARRKVQSEEKHPPTCYCCQHNNDFKIEDHLLHEFSQGRVVLFAGAGVSTESNRVLKRKLVENLSMEINVNHEQTQFPDIMQEYCKRPDGRIKLIQSIKDRIDNIYSHPTLYAEASRFHRELATMFHVDTIITTNWDTIFEEECAATPFVYAMDIPFWEAASRKVVKLHGTLNNFGSIIATRDDYNDTKKNLSKNLIGAMIKHLVSTRTFVFCGYSFNDDTFLSIMDLVSSQLKKFKKTGYFVTIDEESHIKDRCEDYNLIPIITDATYFLSTIKNTLVSKNMMLPDDIYSEAQEILSVVKDAQSIVYDKFPIKKYPDAIFCCAYQDGLVHALERIINLRNSGEYSHRCAIYSKAIYYNGLENKAIKNRKYFDAAYIYGYKSILWFFACWGAGRDKLFPGLFFHFGNRKLLIDSLEDYRKVLKDSRFIHKPSHTQALREALKLKTSKQSFLVRHRCEL